eukprot:COSAG05_NODE_3379_length_2100_cov_1.389805_2_plen_87_part_00
MLVAAQGALISLCWPCLLQAVLDGAAMVRRLFRSLVKYRVALFTAWDEHLGPPHNCRALRTVVGMQGLGAVASFALVFLAIISYSA